MSEHALAFDVVVVGGGPAGLAAACGAAESGQRVAVVDETPWLGGQIWRGQPGGLASAPPSSSASSPGSGPSASGRISREGRGSFGAQRWFARLRASGAEFLAQTAVIAAPEPGLLLAEQAGVPCQIRWRRLVLATGARELFLPFPGWTLPGVVGAGGLLNLVKNGWPVAGQRVLVAGSGPLLLAVADGLRRHGARVAAVIEQAPRSQILAFGLGLWRHPSKLWQGARLRLGMAGVSFQSGAWPVCAEGKDRVQRVTLTDGRKTWEETCDYLACGFGLVPNVELPLLLGCALEDGFVRVDALQKTSVPDIYCAGEPTGIGGADCALVEGLIAGAVAAGRDTQAKALAAARGRWHRFRRRLASAFALRPELKSLAADGTVLCRCEDVTLGQMRRFGSWREAKLHTRCGMGACQGRTCGAAAHMVLGWGMESVRPPVLPAQVNSLISVTICKDSKVSPSLATTGQNPRNELAPR